MGKEVEQELDLKAIEVWIGASREAALPEAEQLDEGLLVIQPGMRRNGPMLGQVAVEEVIEVGRQFIGVGDHLAPSPGGQSGRRNASRLQPAVVGSKTDRFWYRESSHVP